MIFNSIVSGSSSKNVSLTIDPTYWIDNHFSTIIVTYQNENMECARLEFTTDDANRTEIIVPKNSIIAVCVVGSYQFMPYFYLYYGGGPIPTTTLYSESSTSPLSATKVAFCSFIADQDGEVH